MTDPTAPAKRKLTPAEFYASVEASAKSRGPSPDEVDYVARAIATHFRKGNELLEPETLRQAAIFFRPAARAAIEAVRNWRCIHG